MGEDRFERKTKNSWGYSYGWPTFPSFSFSRSSFHGSRKDVSRRTSILFTREGLY